MSLLKYAALLFFVSFFVSLDAAAQMKGTLGLVIDGDSFYMVQDNGRRIRIRLSGIDSPENGQPYTEESKAFLNSLLQDQEIIMTPDGTDKLGRPVAIITAAGQDIAQEMIRNGFAWHYKKYSDDAELARLETEARAEKRGLWADPNAIAPWVYKQQKK